MKKFILSIILAVALIASPVSAEFFPDVIVTSPNGIWTDSRAYATLNAAITAVDANERTIKIVSPQVVAALTVPSNVTLEFERNGSITNSDQLIINSRNIIAKDRQIFTGTGDIDFAVGSVVRSSWFSGVAEAIDVTNDDELTLVISKASFVTSSCAVGDNVNLKWESARNQLTANGGVVISNIKNIEAGNFQLFAGAGDFDFLDGSELKLNWFARLSSVLNWVEDEGVTIIVNEGSNVQATVATTVNENIKILPGGKLTLPVGVTLTTVGSVNAAHNAFDLNATANLIINGPFDAGLHQVFSGTGGVNFGDGAIKEVCPDWWKTNTTPGTTDMASAIESAITAVPASTPMTLSPNTVYAVNSNLTVTKSCIIKGNGATIRSLHAIPWVLTFQGTLVDTITVTSDYDAGDTYITVNSVANVSQGILLSVVSTDTYSVEYANCFLGGTVMAESISGLNVYISEPFPFDLTAANLAIYVYSPITAKISDLTVEDHATAPIHSRGIRIHYSAHSKLENVSVRSFHHDIENVGSYATILEGVRTHAVGATAYGVFTASSTNTLASNCDFQGERHGSSVAGGPRGISLNTRFDRCSFSSGLLTVFDIHQGGYTTTITNSTVGRASLSGHVHFIDCTITSNHGLQPGDVPGRASALYEQCKLITPSGANYLYLNVADGNHTLACPGRIHVDSFILRNCHVPDLVFLQVSLTSSYGSPISASVREIIVENTDNVSIWSNGNDSIDIIIFQNVINDNYMPAPNPYAIYIGLASTLGKLVVNNCKFPAVESMPIALHSFDYCVIQDTEFVDIGAPSSYLWFKSANAIVVMRNVDISNLSHGIRPHTSLGKLILENTAASYYSPAARDFVTVLVRDGIEREIMTTDVSTLSTRGTSKLDSTSNKVDCTLPDGVHTGEHKLITMTNAANASNVTVTHHDGGDGGSYTLDAVDEAVELVWTGTEWTEVGTYGGIAAYSP